MIPDVISWVGQPDDETCVAACLAMVTGTPIDDVINYLPKGGSLLDQNRYLVSRQIWPENVFQLQWGNIYILTVASPNRAGINHAVVADLRDKECPLIYDPQEYKPDKTPVTWEGILDGNPHWSYATLLTDCSDVGTDNEA